HAGHEVLRSADEPEELREAAQRQQLALRQRQVDLRVPRLRRTDQEGSGLRCSDRSDLHQGGQAVGQVSVTVDVQVAERPAVAAPTPAATDAQPAARAPARPAPRPRVRWLAPRREIPDRAYWLLAVASFAVAFLFWTWVSHQSFAN